MVAEGSGVASGPQHGQQSMASRTEGLSLSRASASSRWAARPQQQGQRGSRASGATGPAGPGTDHRGIPCIMSACTVPPTQEKALPRINPDRAFLAISISAHTNTLTIIPSRTRHPDRARRSTVANSLSCSRRFMLHRPSGSPL